MKLLVLALFLIIFASSCQVGTDNHYAFIDKIIDNPELLSAIVHNPNLTYEFEGSSNFEIKYNEKKIKHLEEHIKKYFKSGYEISRDNISTIGRPSGIEYKCHEIALKSKTGDKILYFRFILQFEDLWKIDSINDFDPYTESLKEHR